MQGRLLGRRCVALISVGLDGYSGVGSVCKVGDVSLANAGIFCDGHFCEKELRFPTMVLVMVVYRGRTAVMTHQLRSFFGCFSILQLPYWF